MEFFIARVSGGTECEFSDVACNTRIQRIFRLHWLGGRACSAFHSTATGEPHQPLNPLIEPFSVSPEALG